MVRFEKRHVAMRLRFGLLHWQDDFIEKYALISFRPTGSRQ